MAFARENARDDADLDLVARSRAAVVWGPHFWFFLHAVAQVYPEHPNETLKRKYYDLFTNFPVFLPNGEMAGRLAGLLDDFPVTSYLRNRESLKRYVYYLHAKYNTVLNKDSPESYEASQTEFLAQFRADAVVARGGQENFLEAWSRRRRPLAVLLLLLSAAAALWTSSS